MFILPVVLIAGFLFYIGAFDGTKELPTKRAEQPAQDDIVAEQWETKTDDQPPVTIKATPIELGKDAYAWRFQIVFDTHSGSLDDDILAVASLADEKGSTYRPTAWEGLGPGGHHSEGVLMFNSIAPAPQFVELKIKNVGGIPERSFKWNIQ